MPRALLFLVALLLGCRRYDPGTPPMPTIVAPTTGSDVHSYAHPEQVTTTGLALALDVSFDARTISGVATFELQRNDPSAPLLLDTRGLAIDAVELAPDATTWQ